MDMGPSCRAIALREKTRVAAQTRRWATRPRTRSFTSQPIREAASISARKRTASSGWRWWSVIAGSAPASSPKEGGRSIISTASASRSRGVRTGTSPPQQRALGGKAGAERDHQPPVARHRLARAEGLLEDEEHGRRGHVAEALEHVARGGDLRVVEAEEPPRLVDHPAAGRVQHEVADVLLLEPLRFHQALGHLLHHGGPDTSHVLGQHDALAAAGKLEAHGGQVL